MPVRRNELEASRTDAADVAMQDDQDQAFWEIVYRAVMMIAHAIKKYKLKQPDRN